MAKHTQGPWKVWTSTADNSVNVSAEGTMDFVCECGKIADEDSGDDFDRIRADARLISAAPELYAACQAVVDDWQQGMPPDMGRLRAALARAA